MRDEPEMVLVMRTHFWTKRRVIQVTSQSGLRLHLESLFTMPIHGMALGAGYTARRQTIYYRFRNGRSRYSLMDDGGMGP